MNYILLTQNTTPVFRYIVWILGKLMEGIFNVLDMVGIPNIGLAIIFFTIIINLLMIPLTVKQQKFAKLSTKMNPEMKVIQEKYKNRKDQESQLAMNAEMQQLYAKYGVSPTGSCGYLLIQFPILIALYRVIYSIPAYVGKVGDTFRCLANPIIESDQGEWLRNSGIATIEKTVAIYGKSLDSNLSNGVVDVLNKLSTADMATVAEHYGLTDSMFGGQYIFSHGAERGLIDIYNNFLGLNICNSPQNLIINGFKAGAWAIVIGAALIPILSAVTQWVSVLLMPQQNDKNMDEQTAQIQSSMKTMNLFMPLMSAYFCLTLPAGMGIYWVAGGVVRGIQQVLINKHIDKMDIEKLLQDNAEKAELKMKKIKEDQEKINAYATMKTKNIAQRANVSNPVSDKSEDTSSETRPVREAKPGSIMAKANMVSEYNKKNKK